MRKETSNKEAVYSCFLTVYLHTMIHYGFLSCSITAHWYAQFSVSLNLPGFFPQVCFTILYVLTLELL